MTTWLVSCVARLALWMLRCISAVLPSASIAIGTIMSPTPEPRKLLGTQIRYRTLRAQNLAIWEVICHWILGTLFSKVLCSISQWLVILGNLHKSCFTSPWLICLATAILVLILLPSFLVSWWNSFNAPGLSSTSPPENKPPSNCVLMNSEYHLF